MVDFTRLIGYVLPQDGTIALRVRISGWVFEFGRNKLKTGSVSSIAKHLTRDMTVLRVLCDKSGSEILDIMNTDSYRHYILWDQEDHRPYM